MDDIRTRDGQRRLYANQTAQNGRPPEQVPPQNRCTRNPVYRILQSSEPFGPSPSFLNRPR